MNDYIKLKNPQTLGDNRIVSILLTEIIEQIIKTNLPITVNHWECDSLYFGQMIYSKVKHLIKLSEGFELIENGKKFIDPCIHFILSRNIFESVVYFNLQHIFHKNDEEKELLYRLWRLSSLKYRLRLNDVNSSSIEIQELIKEESNEIDQITNEIKNSNIYANSNQQTRKQIDRCIQKKEFWLIFENGIANSSLGVQQICDKITNNSSLLESQYTRYSLFTHPSNETAIIFKKMFSVNGHEILTANNLRITNCLVAMFILDYIDVYAPYQSVFHSMEDKHKEICKFYNSMIRN